MGHVTKENCETYFDEHRKELNKKIKIDQVSFDKRGLSISIGITEFYNSLGGDINARIKYMITQSDEYEYDGTNMRIMVVAKDDQSFIIDHSKTDIDEKSCYIHANAIDDAQVIEITATGDVPAKKLSYSDGYTKMNASGVEFIIDEESFKRYQIELMAVGFRNERDGKKYCALIFAELRMLPEATFKEYNHIRMCAILKKNNAIVEMGYDDIVSNNKFTGCLRRISIGTGEEIGVSSIVLRLEEY